ncbi:hypothetical protein CVV65_05780 [Kyrpidia spormannii]|uniref:Uncharacterized protein n=1 Tax=Kyrpidia spormannii TaxID=2055160 RepID=A0A2K8N5A5_9BACL|nr:hypothetical protein CVV65_05780 [Kyrpidia spormannii]
MSSAFDAAVSCLGAKQVGRPSAVLTEMARNLIAGMNNIPYVAFSTWPRRAWMGSCRASAVG